MFGNKVNNTLCNRAQHHPLRVRAAQRETAGKTLSEAPSPCVALCGPSGYLCRGMISTYSRQQETDRAAPDKLLVRDGLLNNFPFSVFPHLYSPNCNISLLISWREGNKSRAFRASPLSEAHTRSVLILLLLLAVPCSFILFLS